MYFSRSSHQLVFTATLAYLLLSSSLKSSPSWCWRSVLTTFSSWFKRTSENPVVPTKRTRNTLVVSLVKWLRPCYSPPFPKHSAFSLVKSFVYLIYMIDQSTNPLLSSNRCFVGNARRESICSLRRYGSTSGLFAPDDVLYRTVFSRHI